MLHFCVKLTILCSISGVRGSPRLPLQLTHVTRSPLNSFCHFSTGNLASMSAIYELIIIQAYDYGITFDSELSLIWAAPWSLVKALFLLTRYLPFVEMVLILCSTASHFRHRTPNLS